MTASTHPGLVVRYTRAWRRGVPLRLTTWPDGLVTCLVREGVGTISYTGNPDAVCEWIDAEGCPPLPVGAPRGNRYASRANRNAVAARVRAEMEAAR